MICRRLGAALALAGMLSAARAHAGSVCRLRWDAGTVSDAWSAALHDVDAVVAQLTPETTDCRTIEVLPDADGAAVVFTTVDGRTARRRIGGPSELRPLVEALLVFGHDPLPAPPPPPVVAPVAAAASDALPGSEAEAPAPASREESDAARQAPSNADDVHLLLGAGAGVKGSFPNDTVAAVGQVFAGITVSAWELAGFGRWEVEHEVENDSTSGKLQYSAVGGGAMIGRRASVGPLVLVGGLRGAVFAAEEERGKHVEGQHEHKLRDRFLDPRLGLYAGCIFLETTRVRVRVQVDGDAGVVAHRTELAELPMFPRWNLGISLGAETGLFK